MTRDPRDQEWDDRADRAYSNLTYRPKRTVGRWFLKGLAVIIVLAVIFGVISWVGSWGSETARITGVDNTKAQATQVNDLWQNLTAAADNACGAGADGSSSERSNPNDPVLVEDPALAYTAKYRSLRAEYNRKMSNFFETGIIREYPFLKSYPRHIPNYKESIGPHPNMCGVSSKLALLHDN
jgi:hypothetical protein